jgi:hypothetical protein
MMGKVLKVSQRTGDIGRPKEVEILGGNQKEVSDPEILGAKKVTSEGPTILDRTMKKVDIGENDKTS